VSCEVLEIFSLPALKGSELVRTGCSSHRLCLTSR